jgi:hypothetical protein
MPKCFDGTSQLSSVEIVGAQFQWSVRKLLKVGGLYLKDKPSNWTACCSGIPMALAKNSQQKSLSPILPHPPVTDR